MNVKGIIRCVRICGLIINCISIENVKLSSEGEGSLNQNSKHYSPSEKYLKGGFLMRKVLSFVLVLSLVLGSFSMAFAAGPAGLSDIADSANVDAIQTAHDLGIVTGNPDGTFLPAKTVTRAEFAAMITRALAVPESALAGYTATTFKDTTGYGWAVPYLAFCNSKGIMLGDGNGNVMPGRIINTNEAVTMALRAIGYINSSSQLVGTWPSNYVTLAQNVGLYDDVAAIVNVDKANAAQIIYNLLTVQKVAVNTDGQTNYLWTNNGVDPVSLLTAGLGATAVKGVILGTAGYLYDDCTFSIIDRLGAYGTAYTKSGDVIAFSATSSALTGYIDDGKFVVGDTKYSFAAPLTSASSAGTKIAFNGNAAETTIGGINTDNGDITLNVKVSGKTISEVRSTVAWNVFDGKQVSAADLKAIADGQLLAGDFDLDDDDEIIANSYKLVGATSLDKIKADDVVYVYTDGTNIRKVAVGTEVVTGKVTETGTDYAVVNGAKYYFYATAVAGSATIAVDLPDVGDSVVLTLDYDKYVYDIEASGSADSFAIVKGYDNNLGSSILVPVAKLYTSNDSTKNYDTAEGTDLTATLGSGMTKTSLTPGAIVGYGLDKDGVINNLDLTVVSTAAIAQLKSASIVSLGAATIKVDSNVVVFTKVAGAATYDVTTISNIETGTNLNVDATFQYILNTNTNKIVAMLVVNTAAGKSADDIYAVVNTVTKALDADDNEVNRIQGLVGTDTLDKKAINNVIPVGFSKTTTQAFSFKLDANGNIKGVNVPVDVVALTTVSGIDSDTIKLGTTWYSLSDKVVVYQAELKSDLTVDKYVKSSISSIRSASNYYAMIYDMDNASGMGGYEVVVWFKY